MPGARYVSPVRLSHARSAYSTQYSCPMATPQGSSRFREVRGRPHARGVE